MANTIWIIILAIFTAIMGYGIGLRRGFKTYENEYDRGYNDGLTYCEQHYEMTDVDEMMDTMYREEKARDLIKQLDELFEDDNKVIDGGEY